MTNDREKAFDEWADNYIRKQYPFYNKETASDVGCSLKKQLYEAWQAELAQSPDVGIPKGKFFDLLWDKLMKSDEHQRLRQKCSLHNMRTIVSDAYVAADHLAQQNLLKRDDGKSDEFDYREKLLSDIWHIRTCYKNVFNETEQLRFDRMEKYVQHISTGYNFTPKETNHE